MGLLQITKKVSRLFGAFYKEKGLTTTCNFKKKNENARGRDRKKRRAFQSRLISFTFIFFVGNSYAATIQCPTAKADLWFANDESGSVDFNEFEDSLDFLYQISDGFRYDDVDGIKAGITGWGNVVNSAEVLMPITQNFGDPGDSGLLSLGNITTNGNGTGLRELYISKKNTSRGTSLGYSSAYLAGLINSNNKGRRPDVKQIAVFLTDAWYGQLNSTSYQGGSTWINAANTLKNAGPDGTSIILIIIAEAADAYRTNPTTKNIIDQVVGGGLLIIVDNYKDAADPTKGYITQVINSVCKIEAASRSDWGDAPDSYGTDKTAGNNGNDKEGASHAIVDGLHLGATAPDKEDDGQPSANADADGAEDDAISQFPELTIADTSYTIPASDIRVTNTLAQAATLYGFIDFNRDGDFDDVGESAAAAVASGATNPTSALVFQNYSKSTTAGTTYARFRISTEIGLIATSAAKDGEVEDFTLTMIEPDYDYGDAPDDNADFNYGIAKHILPANADLFLGSKKPTKDEASDHANWKREWDTNGKHKNWFKNNKTRRGHGNGHRKKNEVADPAPDVVGDGAEEDGLVTTALSWNNGTTCTGILPDGTTGSITMTDTRYCITVTASNNSAIAAQLVGWIDFNQNGEFDDPSERSVVDVDANTNNDNTQGNVPAGTNNLPIVIYWENQTKVSGELNTYIRLRLTSDPEFKSNNSPDPIGVAINGEVEDTNIGINVTGTDFGDAPDTYGDASHIIELDAYMGTTIDNDIVSQNSANGGADGVGDDNDGYNDDDGVASFPAIDTNAQTYSIDVTVTSPTSEAANLVGWIDFDGNGVFDTDEAATVTVPQNTTESVVTLTWSSIPSDIQGGSVYIRLRLTTDTSVATGTASSSLPAGLATDGEVEDYSLSIIVGWPVAPVSGPGDGGQCLLTHHTNAGVAAEPNSFYNISDHTNPSTLTKIGPWNIPSGTVEGLTADVANEAFYALNANRSGKLWLGSIDPVTGSFSDITTTGSSTISHSSYGTLSIVQSRAIAHHPGTNTLWLAAYNAQPSSGPGSTYVYLFKMDTSTGEVITGAFSGEDYLPIDLAPYTFNSSNDRPTVEALTFYKNEPNILYGVLSTLSGGSPFVGHLFAVDISKADPQAVLAPNNLSGVSYSGGAAPSSDYSDIEGMSFDANGDLVIVSSNVGGANANSLLTVNVTTGIASNKRTIISGDWEGIVCDPPFAEKDFGDAPSDMSSIDASLTAVYGEAGHVLDGATYLGVLADSESSSQDTGLDADGDDVNGSDDDDGVVFPVSGNLNVLRVGQANNLTITASKAGILNAWIDWNQDGDWDDTNEQIATDLSLVSGANVLSVTPLTTYVQGKTYARFRFSSIAGLSSTGLAADGEVEDYAVNLTLATPVNVCSPTLLNNGFENPTVPSGLIIQLEDTIEGWSTQAVNPASGSSYSDRNSIEIWESGFQGVPAYQGNQFAELNANVSGALYQDVELAPGTTVGWSFAHRARSGTDTIKVLMGSPNALIEQGQYTSGTGSWEVYSGSYTVPFGQTVTRFSFQSVDAGSLGNFIDAIELPGGCDFGDAPDSYLTKLSSDGAHHISNSLLYLGTEFADSEDAAFGGDDTDNSGTASDDDNEGDRPDDEDGVTSFDEIDDLDTTYSTAIIVKNTTGSAANLVGWIDFDGNGTFDTDEAATVAIPNNTNGSLNLNWNNIPSDITSGDTFVRLRLTTDSTIATGDATTSTPSGMAKDGEVEDYPLFIKIGGFPVKGRVYNDSNVDGLNDNSEAGISDLPVVLLDVTKGTCISTRTDADGNYEFFPVIPGDYRLYEASRETVPTPQNCDVALAKDPANYRSTTTNALVQFSVVDAETNGQDFGDVAGPTFEPDNTGTILAGSVEFYAHKFTAKSTGSVDFTSSNSGGATAGWSSVIYQDFDCNGQLETAEAAAAVASDLVTVAGQDVCLINKVHAPTGVSAGETFANVISADFNFNNNALAGTTTLKVTDLSKAAANDPVLGSSKLELRKTVQNITQSSAETETQNQAKPGDILQYRIYYSNVGTGVITDLKINDVVPAFTVLNGVPVCETPLPASLTSCTPAVNGNSIEWIFPVNDQLKAGAQGVVSYNVTID